MFFDVLSFQQNTTFSVTQPFWASSDSLTYAGSVTIVVCIQFAMVTIAGFTSEVSVAVRTEDPLFELTG